MLGFGPNVAGEETIPPPHLIVYHKVTYMSSVWAGVLGEDLGQGGVMFLGGNVARCYARNI